MKEQKAIVIDVPMGGAVVKAGFRWCRRLRANGEMCGRAAEEGMDECRWHAEWYTMLPAVFGMPYPEDAVAIHQILARTVSMVINKELTPQQASAIATLCKEMRRNLPWFAMEMARIG